jgi:hypothetical protein
MFLGTIVFPKKKNEGHIIGMYVSRFFNVNDNGKVTLDALQNHAQSCAFL